MHESVRADQEESAERNIMSKSESWSIYRTGSESQDTRGRGKGTTVTPSTLWGQDKQRKPSSKRRSGAWELSDVNQ